MPRRSVPIRSRADPNRLCWVGIISKSWNNVPMDVMKLVAEAFVVDPHRLQLIADRARDRRHVIPQLALLIQRKLRQLLMMLFESSTHHPR